MAGTLGPVKAIAGALYSESLTPGASIIADLSLTASLLCFSCVSLSARAHAYFQEGS